MTTTLRGVSQSRTSTARFLVRTGAKSMLSFAKRHVANAVTAAVAAVAAVAVTVVNLIRAALTGLGKLARSLSPSPNLVYLNHRPSLLSTTVEIR